MSTFNEFKTTVRKWWWLISRYDPCITPISYEISHPEGERGTVLLYK